MRPRYLLYSYKWIFILLAGMLLFACRAEVESAAPIRIGVIASTTGNLADIGHSTIKAAQLAADLVNEEGGILVGRERRLVELVIEDDQNIPDTAVEAARKLIYQDNVVAIIGPQFSNTASRVATVAETAEIPMITPGSTNPEITASKQYVFRIPFVDTVQGTVLARFAREKLQARTAAILFDATDTYNQGIATFFRDAFTSSGGTVAVFDSYVKGDTDFYKQLTHVRDSHADVLLLPNFSHDVQLQAEQAYQLGITTTIIGSDSWTREVLSQVPELDGAFFSTYYAPAAEDDEANSFTTAYESRYGEEADAAAALTYDAFQLLFQAIEAEGTATPVGIRQGLSQTEDFTGITGSFSYAGNGDPIRDVTILQIKDKEAIFFESFEP